MPTDPFSDIDAFLALPRVGEVRMSPDGRRLVVGISTLDSEKARNTTALWEVDPAGKRQARRLTRSSQGETAAAFTPSGDLLFLSARPGPQGEERALWLLPAEGGDARLVASPPGGVSGVVVSESGTVVLGSSMMPSAVDVTSDREMRAKREDGRVSAILHEEFPVRFWDHDLGPDRTRLFTTEIPDGDAEWELRDLTGHIGAALNDECTWDLTPDGRTVVATWVITEPGGSLRRTLVAIDVATGERRILADDPDHEYDSPRLSPDGTLVAVCVRKRLTPEDPGDLWLGLVPVAGGELRALAAEWDRWPRSPRWTPDGTALVVAADDQGRSPLWRVDVATGHPVRLTADNGTYTDFYVSPDGHWVYARRSAIDSPPAPVRLALDGLSAAERLPHPAEPVALPGRLEEVTTLAEDGTPVRGWLAVPHGASAEAPAPLLVSIHGGPVMSAKDWSWGWNPWPAVARGYAVLQPDFALSTGYGIDFIRRGWGQWGGTPYTDVTSITDAAQERPEIDPERAAAMGASFGGYMANWIAGHTNRFKAIVTHASIWSLDQSIGASDISYFFTREMTAEAADAHSPHHFADAMTTPMLITHGDKDYRVPISEALQLWWALSSRWKAENSPNPHKFLYFPGENHFILKPNNVKVWYTTYLTFLDHHVRGEKWQRPDLLG